MSTLRERLEERGWAVVPVPTGKKDGDWFCTASTGSLLMRRGPVRLELKTTELVEHEGSVRLYDPRDARVAILAIVVDDGARRQRHGEAALLEVIELCEGKIDWLMLEACPMGARKFKAKMRQPDLIAWYERHGFRLVDGATRVMQRRMREAAAAAA